MLEPATFASTPAAKGINDNFEKLDKQNQHRHKLLHEKFPDIFKDIYAANKSGEEPYSNLGDFIPGDYVCLSVSDDGCGMSPEIQKQIFEPFFTTKGQRKGTGLGLAMVYGIVKQNNGFIHISSELDQGTTFKIYLPRYTGSVKEHPQEHDNHGIPKGDESILLVEDEPELLKVSEQMLKELGYTVLAVAQPDEAIRYAE